MLCGITEPWATRILLRTVIGKCVSGWVFLLQGATGSRMEMSWQQANRSVPKSRASAFEHEWKVFTARASFSRNLCRPSELLPFSVFLSRPRQEQKVRRAVSSQTSVSWIWWGLHVMEKSWGEPRTSHSGQSGAIIVGRLRPFSGNTIISPQHRRINRFFFWQIRAFIWSWPIKEGLRW